MRVMQIGEQAGGRRKRSRYISGPPDCLPAMVGREPGAPDRWTNHCCWKRIFASFPTPTLHACTFRHGMQCSAPASGLAGLTWPALPGAPESCRFVHLSFQNLPTSLSSASGRVPGGWIGWNGPPVAGSAPIRTGVHEHVLYQWN